MTELALSVRLDSWLWAARFYKTRRLASEQLRAGKVKIDGVAAKASKLVKPGSMLEISRPPYTHLIEVVMLSSKRGPASIAQKLYKETAESLANRQQLAAHLKQQHRQIQFDKTRPSARDRRRGRLVRRGDR